jgi:UDP-glucose 6-dehydrogenase
MVESIGIIGHGVVGHALARTYIDKVDVRIFDKLTCKTTHGLGLTLESDLVFICLPEWEVDNFLSCLSHSELEAGHFVIKSTVPVGTTATLRKHYKSDIIHSPEFLTERCAVIDALTPARNIIGGPTGETCDLLTHLYTRRFPGVQILFMTSDESEMVKLFVNAFFATKIAFFNEMYTYWNNYTSDMTTRDSWDRIMAGILSDGRIAHSHTQVPGPDGEFGFGGKCLPKDLETLIGCMWQSNVVTPILSAVERRNEIDRRQTASGQAASAEGRKEAKP